MTNQEKSQKLKFLMDEAPRIKEWRKVTLIRLLSEIGPQIAKLKYPDRSIVKLFKNLIEECNEYFQPSMNHLETYMGRWDSQVTTEILFDLLLEDIEKAKRV